MTTQPQENSPAAKPSLIRLPKRVMGWLAAVILLGTLLRLIGLGWSLPDTRHPYATYHPDERINLNAALQADVSHLKFDIGFYNYGAFYFYLVNVAHIVGRGYGVIPKLPETPDNAPPALELQAKENAGLFFMGRLVTALMGIATIPVVFGIGRRFYSDNVGLFAAFLYAVAPLAVVHAHFLTVDVPATLFVALALLYSARLLENVTVRNLILAGVWTGLAAATKYNAVLVGIAPLTALLIRPPNPPSLGGTEDLQGGAERESASLEEQTAAQKSERSHGNAVPPRIGGLGGLIFAASLLVTFLIACPGVWLNFDAFWNGIPGYPGSGVRYELFEHSREGHGELFIKTGIGIWYHFVISLWQGLTWPFLVLFLIGVGVAFRRKTSADRVLLIFFFVAYLLYSLSAVRFARYMLPLFPVICMLAARAVIEAKSKKIRGGIRSWGGMAAGYATVIALLCTAVMHGEDPRDRAADWMEKNAKSGAIVAFGRVPWFSSPPLDPRFGLPAAPQRAAAVNNTTRYTFRIHEKEWDMSVLNPPPDFVIVSNLETMHPLRLDNATAKAFLAAAQKDRTAEVFAPAFSSLLVGNNATIFTEDMLYIMPTVTIYHQ